MGNSKIQVVTLRLNGREIDTQARTYVGFPRQRNVPQVPIVILLNEAGHRATSNSWSSIVDSVAICITN